MPSLEYLNASSVFETLARTSGELLNDRPELRPADWAELFSRIGDEAD
jgi:hypothetical protein